MPGPTPKLSHDDCRSKVCAVCYCRSGSKAVKKVSDRHETAIKELVFADYKKDDPRFPCGLCLPCYFSLADNIQGFNIKNEQKPPRLLLLPDPETYDNELQRNTRSSSTSSCQCRICSIARTNGLQWKMFVSKCKKGPTAASPVSKYDRLCKLCMAPIYRGSNHSEERCKSKRQSLENITNAVAYSNTSIDIVASKLIKSKMDESSSNIIELRSDTGGHPITVTIGKNESNGPQSISVDQARVIQVEANLSDAQMGKVVKNLRLQLGRKIVEPGLRESLVMEKSKFDSFFSADVVQFSDSEGKPINRPFVYCSDILGFVGELAMLRGLSVGDLILKVGVDGGKGHLKMILTMYEPDNLLVNMGGGNRVTREAGIGSGEQYSLLGRKKVMILAIAPKVPENYTNLQLFYDMVGLNKLQYKQTGDMKALNILLGMMSCSSQCGCCYCDAKRSAKEWVEGGAKLRSAGSLAANAKNFQHFASGDRDRAKDISANCVHTPIIFDEDDDPSLPVLLKCPPPALHLKLSLNKLLVELSKVWPPILDWLASKHIVLEPYHGGMTLEGNDCSKVLRNLHHLEEVLPANFSNFLATFKAFRDVVDSCFGFILDPFYKQVLERFKIEYQKLQDKFNVSMPNKIHVIVVHLEEFFDLVGRGLGEFSEQETENAHSAFDSLLDRYRVKDINSLVYHVQYFKAVMNFNSNNV